MIRNNLRRVFFASASAELHSFVVSAFLTRKLSTILHEDCRLLEKGKYLFYYYSVSDPVELLTGCPINILMIS